MTMNRDFFATAPRHVEPLLADELRALGCADVREGRGGVAFGGGLESAYRACLWSRLANRVLLVLARFPAASADALYRGARDIAWEDHMQVEDTFAVAAAVSNSAITHSQYAALKVKDAVADRFRDACGRRPSVSPERPALQLNVYLLRDEATVGLDLSGESLHRRGYRHDPVAAPLKENLAAAILLRAGWPQLAAAGAALVDPLCGSGTLLIEAALIAADSAPGLQRDYWGFAAWRRHDAALWAALREEARRRRSDGLARIGDIRGYDHDPAAVRAALANVGRAGLHGHVHVERRELRDCRPGRPSDTGLVVANPPYGERLGEHSELPALYRTLGDVLRQRFIGWRAAVLTGNPELGKAMGLRARRTHQLYNGALPCRLLQFEVDPQWFAATGPRPLPPEARGEGAQMFANRLQKNLRHLGRWARREDIHAWRVYDADLPEYAVAVDVYETADGRFVQVQEYEPPRDIDEGKARRRLREALGVVGEVLETAPDRVQFKLRRRQRGASQYQRLGAAGRFHEVAEGDCRFLVNFEDYLDTGLFLDHRLTRRMIGELADGRHVLNLFAYTATASVYAAKGGALSTTSVDMSASYLEWARRNLALNGLDGPAHTLVQADCLAWLNRPTQRRYGLIFLDPPTFSTSKRMSGTLDIQRDHGDLIRRAAALLDAGGDLIFSTNLRRFRLDHDALAGLTVVDVSRATLPKDFERNPRIHHCWRIRRGP